MLYARDRGVKYIHTHSINLLRTLGTVTKQATNTNEVHMINDVVDILSTCVFK